MYYLWKRLIDLIVAGLLILILSPLLLVIALLVKSTSRGPAIFSQKRVGARRNADGSYSPRTFTFYKFRTMRSGFDSALHRDHIEAYIANDLHRLIQPEDARRRSATYKVVSDPRVTPLGKVLRKFSLDELPQLWNVLRGEMSLVGPRPPIPYEVELYDPDHLTRLRAKPGVTGLWQVSGRCTTTFEEMVELDVEYIKNRSVRLDLAILLRTVPTVLSTKGAE